MRESYDAIIEAAEALGRDGKPLEHIENYGVGDRGPPHRRARDRAVERVQLRRVRPRCIGAHPVAGRDRQKGYIEDRRPNANVDPYVVTRLIIDTCGTALEKAGLT